MSDDALLDAIRGVLAESPFHGEGHRKVWARLRVGGVRTSKPVIFRGFGGHPEAIFKLEVFDGSAGDESQATFLYGGV